MIGEHYKLKRLKRFTKIGTCERSWSCACEQKKNFTPIYLTKLKQAWKRTGVEWKCCWNKKDIQRAYDKHMFSTSRKTSEIIQPLLVWAFAARSTKSSLYVSSLLWQNKTESVCEENRKGERIAPSKTPTLLYRFEDRQDNGHKHTVNCIITLD